jgi:hypothetical protein
VLRRAPSCTTSDELCRSYRGGGALISSADGRCLGVERAPSAVPLTRSRWGAQTHTRNLTVRASRPSGASAPNNSVAWGRGCVVQRTGRMEALACVKHARPHVPPLQALH